MKHIPLRSLSALIVASYLAPSLASAASLGPLTIQSTPTQAFAATVLLTPTADENPANLGVRLASPEKFDEIGLPWRYQFAQLQVHSQMQADGSIVVTIRSDQAFAIDDMALLLEISHPKGAHYQITKALRTDTTAHIAPFSRKTGFNPESLSPDQSQYGPIQATDTLWSIAKHMAHQHGISTKQMLDNLYRNNPEAFHNGRMDVMKPGAVLRLSSEIAPRQQPVKTSQPSTTSTSKALDLIAPAIETSKPELSSQEPSKSLPPGTHPATAGGEGDYLFLQTRVETLEQQINMMQQLLTLKDQQLTQLQNNTELQFKQQTQLLILSMISSLLAIISLGLGWFLWRNRSKPSATTPTINETPAFSPQPPAPAVIAVTERQQPAPADEFGFDFDPSKHLPPKITLDRVNEDWDEESDDQENKIDLARAYFDMGDIDMANQIAREVLDQGNTDQQKQAQALLDAINFQK